MPTCLLHPNIAKRHRRVGIRLDADESNRLPAYLCNAAGGIWIVEGCCYLRGAGLRIGQGYFVMVPGNDDVVLKPYARKQWRTWRVLLQAIVISAEMIDKISSRNLVNRPGSIFPKAIRFWISTVEIFVHISSGIVIDLDFEA